MPKLPVPEQNLLLYNYFKYNLVCYVLMVKCVGFQEHFLLT